MYYVNHYNCCILLVFAGHTNENTGEKPQQVYGCIQQKARIIPKRDCFHFVFRETYFYYNVTFPRGVIRDRGLGVSHFKYCS